MSNALRISQLEQEKSDLMCCYSSMKACQQDRVDQRIKEINEELEELKES